MTDDNILTIERVESGITLSVNGSISRLSDAEVKGIIAGVQSALASDNFKFEINLNSYMKGDR